MQTIKHAIILAGGRGTRLSEQTTEIPKPLVEVGGIPIIEHIINHLASQGVENVIIAGGYKVDLIKDYFMSNKHRYQGDITLSKCGTPPKGNPIPKGLENLIIADTGLNTGTAQRIKLSKKYIPEGEPFFVTYGDSPSDVDLSGVQSLLGDGTDMVLTAVNYRERFGILHIDEEQTVTRFVEKSMSKNEYINGGFIACTHQVFDDIKEDDTDFSSHTMPRIQGEGRLKAYVHKGFWAAMDTQRDWEELNALFERKPELFIRGGN